MNVALSRLDLDDLDDLTTVLAELKLTREDAPLVWLAEKLINQIRSGGSPTGIAALSAWRHTHWFHYSTPLLGFSC